MDIQRSILIVALITAYMMVLNGTRITSNCPADRNCRPPAVAWLCPDTTATNSGGATIFQRCPCG
jgi:hypothetical protein